MMPTMSDEEARAALKQHKLKVTLLNPTSSQAKQRRIVSFQDMRARFGISSRLAGNLDEQGYSAPTEVQMGALPILLDAPDHYLGRHSLVSADIVSVLSSNLLTVAPTGSGKTLAFMLPLLHRVQSRRHQDPIPTKAVSAIVLAPTKELVGQITNEGRKLAKGTGINVTQLRKGMRLSPPTRPSKNEAEDASQTSVMSGEPTIVKADVLISTPGLLQSMLSDERNSSRDALLNVQEFVLDEADVLLDPLFREQTLGVWRRLTNARLSVSLWSATMGSNIEELARTTIKDWQEQHVANVVAMAQKQEGSSTKQASVQPWLLDALPKLSKEKKQTLKKRGIESRTTRGKANDSKAVRGTRISSKAGFVKQVQNNRKGAILGSQRRAQAEALGDVGDDSDFAGFD
ncbi:RNA-dependent ATPase rok1 [Rachicladosporium monterosium]|uniref:ATP-dependent RNA helicase n=1 Tax=Rachicladosporium monterosium TaxID=1507873 RepID=A0ABR0L408_9PEZI|nr:RNA-dependent ATPase rok1 [Rachicladosporium monterosium]